MVSIANKPVASLVSRKAMMKGVTTAVYRSISRIITFQIDLNFPFGWRVQQGVSSRVIVRLVESNTRDALRRRFWLSLELLGKSISRLKLFAP